MYDLPPQPTLVLDAQSVVRATPEQVSSELGDEVVILGLTRGTYYGLNEIGARIWSLIQEPRTVHDIVDRLLEEYDVERERCEQDVLNLLRRLRREGLIALT